jgi:hypothetical protein
VIFPISNYLVCLFIAGLFLNDPLMAQPDEILLNHSKEFGRSRLNPVRFSHEKHLNDFDCLDCHHRYKDKKNVLDKTELEEGSPAAKCTTCHNPGSNCQLQGVFHKMCLGCHTQLPKTGRKSGPRLCIECHPRDPFAVKGGL